MKTRFNILLLIAVFLIILVSVTSITKVNLKNRANNKKASIKSKSKNSNKSTTNNNKVGKARKSKNVKEGDKYDFLKTKNDSSSGGHYEKVIKKATQYFWVSGNKPSGLPGSYVVSEHEAKGNMPSTDDWEQ